MVHLHALRSPSDHLISDTTPFCTGSPSSVRVQPPCVVMHQRVLHDSRWATAAAVIVQKHNQCYLVKCTTPSGVSLNQLDEFVPVWFCERSQLLV